MAAVVCGLVAALAGPAWAGDAPLDLSGAVIVKAGDSPVVGKTATMLQEEIEARTGLRLAILKKAPGGDGPAILLGTAAAMPAPAERGDIPEKAEGYGVWVEGSTVYLVGRDDRGALFGAGCLLRSLSMTEGALALDPGTRVATAPFYPIRGHQLGYRNTANSYDAWDIDTYEQYIRDLAVFGSNCIELIPDLDPEKVDGPVMAETVWDMTVKLTALLDSYGLDVWMWLPIDGDVSDPATAEEELEMRRALFQANSRIDHIFVPGGDPGHTAPDVLMPWLARMNGVMQECHPGAGLWVSNQGFTHEQNDYFFTYLQEHEPDWLAGVVYGPWAKISLREMRDRTPAKYPIRRYPDICHCIACQYPPANWDQAFALTLWREPMNPRPMGHAHIHNSLAPLADGFATYSDGISDDVNKFIWTAMGWDPTADVHEVLRQYGDYFISNGFGDAIADGLLAQEKNWDGPLLGNKQIGKTFKQWCKIEKQADEEMFDNWRFQMGLYRAYYDAYVQERLEYETDLEEQAYRALRRADKVGVAKAIQSARDILAKADTHPVGKKLRDRIEELGADLHESIGMQLDEKRYKAKNPERGATLCSMDAPLNDRIWLDNQFAHVLAGTDEEDRLILLNTILHWEDPGAGGLYDDLGKATKQPHLVYQKTWEEDPGFVESPQDEQKGALTGSYMASDVRVRYPWKLSWLDQAQTLFSTPLKMRYEGLDPKATYRLRVTYAGRFGAVMRLVADGAFEIHGPMAQPATLWPVEFDVPQEATGDGVLDLEWQLLEKRGCQVAEAWLIRVDE